MFRSGQRVMAGALAMGLVAATVLGCASTAPTPSPTVSPSPSAPLGGVDRLDRFTQVLGCDTIGVDYRSMTIHIDPAAEPVVWAETDTGERLDVLWTPGFQLDESGDVPVVRGTAGEEVAREGTVINMPDGSFPDLQGYFVCPGPTQIIVAESEPE